MVTGSNLKAKHSEEKRVGEPAQLPFPKEFVDLLVSGPVIPEGSDAMFRELKKWSSTAHWAQVSPSAWATTTGPDDGGT